MSFDTIKDYSASLLGAIFLLISIILIPEIRSSRKRVIGLSLLVIVLLGLGIDKINRDNNKENVLQTEKNESKKKSDSLFLVIKTIDEHRKIDSSENSEFKKKLENKFSIIQDSITRQPIRKIFNTHIERVGTLNQF
jgi:hypothetical protein